MAKEKIHNFGLLGKWSESTLRANWYSWNDVLAIEEKYAKECKRINDNIDHYGEMKVKKMNISNLAYYLKYHKAHVDEIDEIVRDYQKYKSIITKFKKK